jgi:D-amino-acid dehydrogenase
LLKTAVEQTSRTTRHMPPHIVILGAGAVGLCTAWYCQQRGFRVTVVERHGPERDGCSYGNAGLLVPSHFVPLAAPGVIPLALRWMFRPDSPLYVRPRLSWELFSWGFRFWRASTRTRVNRGSPVLCALLQESQQLFDELSEVCAGAFPPQRRGLMMLCRTQQALDHEAELAESAHRLGLSTEVLDRRATAERDPAMSMDVCGSVYFASDAHVVPGDFMRALQRQLEAAGVDFVWKTEVLRFDVRSGRVAAVVTSTESIEANLEADHMVLAGGAWTGEIARELGLRIPMQPGKGYSLTLASPPQRPTIPSICVEGRLAVTPMNDALRFGGTMELSGFGTSISPARIRGIIRTATEYFPRFQASDFEGVTPWQGLRPLSPDGLPYLGRTARYSNVLVAAGHAMLGISLAPISGKRIADLIAGDPPHPDSELLSPDRYG